MRRRREIDLKNDIADEVKSVAGKLLFWLIKKLVDKLLIMLIAKGWVTELEEDNQI